MGNILIFVFRIFFLLAFASINCQEGDLKVVLSRYCFFQRYLHDYLQPAEKKVAVSNWIEPTREDYKNLQHYPLFAKRPLFFYMEEAKCSPRCFF